MSRCKLNLDRTACVSFSDIISQRPRPELELQQSCVRTVYFSSAAFSGRRIRQELQQIGKELASRMASSASGAPSCRSVMQSSVIINWDHLE